MSRPHRPASSRHIPGGQADGGAGRCAHAGAGQLLFAGGGLVRPLTVRRSAQARRMTLAVDPRDGMVRLTVPKRAALTPALEWVSTKRGWIEAALAALPARTSLADGAPLPFEGREIRIAWMPGAGRGARLAGDELVVGGPVDHVAARVLRWLRHEALARLEAETRAMAAEAGIAVGRIGVGDPKSRWGSCTSAGDIRYSWRLVLAPPEVRRATIAHELGHRLHMDHSPAFHAAVERLFGRCPKPERAWLRANGAKLQAVGRE